MLRKERAFLHEQLLQILHMIHRIHKQILIISKDKDNIWPRIPLLQRRSERESRKQPNQQADRLAMSASRHDHGMNVTMIFRIFLSTWQERRRLM